MPQESEKRTCAVTGEEFEITADDFGFYEQMKVPAPTWSPRERFIRRLCFVGYSTLYKRTCDKTGENLISIWSPEVEAPVYRQDIWWSDDWDARDYGVDYDFERPFFEQWNELMNRVPRPSLLTDYSTMVNSDYCNGAGYLKDCYLCFKADYAENCAYLNTVSDGLKDSLDLAYSNTCELCYDLLYCNKCYTTFWSENCTECSNVYFSSDLVGCSDCFACINLRKKQYCIFNEQYTKEQYEEKIKEFDWSTHEKLDALKKQAREFWLTQPRRAFRGFNNHDVTGDYVYGSKNAHNCYMFGNCEDVKYCAFLKSGNAKKCYDYSLFALDAEWIYECAWCGLSVNTMKFCVMTYHAHHLEYCFACHGSENCFGCIGLKKAQYCIFNKQYSKEEYHEIVAKIKEQMDAVPYIDKLGRSYKYGEFFPPELALWPYNESQAMEFFPLTKEEAEAKGYWWRDPDSTEYQAATAEIPERAADAPDDFVNEILKCEVSGKNYRLIPMELQFYKRFNIPIPKKHSMVRDQERIGRLNPPEIYERKCAKTGVDILTSYAPDRPEIVYSEEAYRDEVM